MGAYRIRTMRPDEMRALAAPARTAHLATTRPDGAPHVVVVVFVIDTDVVYTPIDRKPKRSQRQQRLRNIEHDARVSLLVDHYSEEWTELWWVRLDGRARVVADGDELGRALGLLTQKYRQYEETPIDNLVIGIDIDRWSSWSWRE